MKKSMGMSFIEVLVALFLISTAILGAVAMQASAKKGSFDALQRSLASTLVQDIIEKMRSNNGSVTILESYEGTYGGGDVEAPDAVKRCNSTANLCTPAQRVSNDLYEWEQNIIGSNVTEGTNNKGGLIDAKGCIEHSKNAITVVISWQGGVETVDSAASGETVATSCGTKNSKRRQVLANVFIF